MTIQPWPILKLFGIPIRLHPLAPILVLVLMVTLYSRYGWPQTISALTIVFLAFVAVLCHELGHALVAQKLSARVRCIVIGPLLNGTFLEREPLRPRDEIKIALGGPVANLGLALITAIVLAAVRSQHPEGWLARVLWISLLMHFVMGVGNLLPGLPLDGGKVLRALLGQRFPWLIATRLAVRAGTTVALCLPVLALLHPFVQQHTALLILIIVVSIGVWRASTLHLAASHRREMELQWSKGNPPLDPDIRARWPQPPPLPPHSYRPLTKPQYEKWRKICEAACKQNLGLSKTS